MHAPGFYVDHNPEETFIGVGIWRPEGDTLRRLRQAIVDAPDAWVEIRDDAAFQSTFEVAGERLKRAPRGFPADHPLVEDLKQESFVASATWGSEAAIDSNFVDRVAMSYETAAPFVRFLCGALEFSF